MSDESIDKSYENNFVKYLLAVNKAKRQCLEGAFSLLYLAWGGGRKYQSLHDFCTEVLGWKNQDLKNLLCEAQMRHISVSSGSRCYSSSFSKTPTPCSPISADESSPFCFEDHYRANDCRSGLCTQRPDLQATQKVRSVEVLRESHRNVAVKGPSSSTSLPNIELQSILEKSAVSLVKGSLTRMACLDEISESNQDLVDKSDIAASCSDIPVYDSTTVSDSHPTGQALQSEKIHKEEKLDLSPPNTKADITRSSHSLNHGESPVFKIRHSLLDNHSKKLFNFSQSINSLSTSSQKSLSKEEDCNEVTPDHSVIQPGNEPMQTATCVSQPQCQVAYMTHPVQKATQIIQDVNNDVQGSKESVLEKCTEKSEEDTKITNHAEKGSQAIDDNTRKNSLQKEINEESSHVNECSGTYVENNGNFEIPFIVKDAVHEMHYNPDDPFDFHEPLDVLSCFMLQSQVDPSKLPERVLILMLTEVFPKLPPTVAQCVNRMKHLIYVVCYLDYNFDDAFLKVKLDELYVLVSDLLTLVAQSCRSIMENCIKESSNKFQSSKRRLRSARKSYYEHLNLVVKTREELNEAEKVFQKAQERHSKVEFSLPQDNDSLVNEISSTDKPRHSRVEFSIPQDNTSAVNEVNDIDKPSDSCSTPKCKDPENTSLAEEPDGEGEDSHTSSSLLTSVMGEVAVIRNGRGRETSVKSKRSQRNSRLVKNAKQGFRNSLHSNVSAEQEYVIKGDIVSERQAERNRFARHIRKLRKYEKKICDDELAIKQHIKASLDLYMEGNLDESSLAKGRYRVREVRNGKFGQFLIRTRREAIKLSSEFALFDIKAWLIKRKLCHHDVQQVFSLLKVNNSNENVDILDIIDIDGSGPSVIVLSGPKGCGKTYMCHYVLSQWKRSNHLVNSKIHEFDIVLYVTLENILLSGSWYQYLRDHICKRTLNELPYADVEESFSRMTLLILLDINMVSTAGIKVLEDLLKNLGHSKLVIAVRCGDGSEITEILRTNDLSFIKAKFCSMTFEAVSEFASQLISLTESRNEKEAMQFTELIRSLKCLGNLLYPLYVTYLLYLWLINPSYVQHTTTVSRLFTQVTLTCQNSLTEVTKNKTDDEKRKARRTIQDYINQLLEATWKLIMKENWKLEDLIIFREDSGTCKDPKVWRFFHPFIFVRESADKKKEAVLLHSSLSEVLCGFYFASKLLSQKKGLFNRRPKLETYLQPDVKRYKDVLLHVAGVLVYNKHSTEDAKEIVMVYGKALSGRVFSSWLELLKECDFMSSLCVSVSNELMQYATWSVANYSKEKNLIMADLLRKGAYQPKQVIISNKDHNEGEDNQGVHCIISSLSTCTTTLVHLRQELQFYTWGDKVTSDVQVIPLQPPGTLQTCWGHLGVEGVMALRHSHHLEELYVRISSCEALCALSNCLVHLQKTLRYLYLRLDISPSIPSSSLQPLQFKGKKLWFRLRNINDSSVIWVIETVNKLNSWYTEVVLEESRLSPISLHNLKDSLRHISLHVSS